MSPNNKQEEKKYFNAGLIKKGRYFSPRVSTLIILNILALASKVSAVHNWNASAYNATIVDINNLTNSSDYQKESMSYLLELFSGISAYGRNDVGKILEEEQDALSGEPMDGYKVWNYDELNKLIGGVFETSTAFLITNTSSETTTTTPNFYYPIINTTEATSVFEPPISTSYSYFSFKTLPTATANKTIKLTSPKSKQLIPENTADTPPWLLDSFVSTSTLVSRATPETQTRAIKGKPIFLRAKKLYNKNIDANSTIVPQNNTVGLNDIFESKGSATKKTINVLAILSISYLFCHYFFATV